jgi:hypothetical protein
MTMEKNVPFYVSRKFWMEIVAAGVFLTLALTQTVVFTSEEVMIFVLGLAGIAVGGHALTDVGSQIAAAIIALRAPQPVEEPEEDPEDEPEEEPEVVTASLTDEDEDDA